MNWTRDRISVAKGIVAVLAVGLGVAGLYALVRSVVSLVLPNAPYAANVMSLLIVALVAIEFFKNRMHQGG